VTPSETPLEAKGKPRKPLAWHYARLKENEEALLRDPEIQELKAQWEAQQAGPGSASGAPRSTSAAWRGRPWLSRERELP
jgi:hypothetical protein